MPFFHNDDFGNTFSCGDKCIPGHGNQEFDMEQWWGYMDARVYLILVMKQTEIGRENLMWVNIINE